MIPVPATFSGAADKDRVMSQFDADLLDADGEPSLFEEFVRRHFRVISRYVARRVGARDAEDLVSEVFAVAYSQRHRYDRRRRNGLPWLYGIATNVIRNHRRQEVRMLRAYARTGVHPGLPDISHHDDDLGPALAAALAAMRAEHRDALLLHTLGDLSYEEIAEALKVPIGTVRSWVNRARATATKELARHGIVPRRPTTETEVTET